MYLNNLEQYLLEKNFLTAKTAIMNQAKKAMYLFKVRIRNLNLPLDCQLLLFDQTILPILTYGSEIWGFSKIDIIEKVHTDFFKIHIEC